MKAQEKKLIVDLYKHYKSVAELSDDEIDVIYNKYGKIRDILKNLIQEFEPDAIITEDYLDEKLRAYGISEVDDLNNGQDEILISNDEVPKKGKSKLLLISLIIIVATGISVFVLFNENKEVRIGDQIWMSKNLNVIKFRNGDPIPEAKTAEEWKKAGENKQPAWSYYNNDPANGAKYGKLYNWYAVNDSRGLAPEGWKIPSDEDWSRLTDFLGGERVAGKKMKSTDFWADNNDESGKGTNESEFSGLPGGDRYDSGTFDGIGYAGIWWSSTGSSTSTAWFRNLGYGIGYVYRSDSSKANGFSVRCLRRNDDDEIIEIKEPTQEPTQEPTEVETNVKVKLVYYECGDNCYIRLERVDNSNIIYDFHNFDANYQGENLIDAIQNYYYENWNIDKLIGTIYKVDLEFKRVEGFDETEYGPRNNGKFEDRWVITKIKK